MDPEYLKSQDPSQWTKPTDGTPNQPWTHSDRQHQPASQSAADHLASSSLSKDPQEKETTDEDIIMSTSPTPTLINPQSLPPSSNQPRHSSPESQHSDVSQKPITPLPSAFHLCPTLHLTRIIGDMLQKLILYNDKIPITAQNLTRFHSRAAPSISIHDYLERIVKYAGIEKVSLIMVLLYIDRICQRSPDFTISSLTVHRFIITAVTCSSKALCDTFLTNSAYAKVGGVTTKELNILEIEFLYLIDWQLVAPVDILQNYYVNLVRQHPMYRIPVSEDESQVLPSIAP